MIRPVIRSFSPRLQPITILPIISRLSPSPGGHVASRADVLESRLGIEKVGGRRTDGEMVMSLGPVGLAFAAEAVQAEAGQLGPVFRTLIADFRETFSTADFGPRPPLPLREELGHTELLEFILGGSYGGRSKEEVEARFPKDDDLPTSLSALIALGEVSGVSRS